MPETFSVVRCTSCGIARTLPRPRPDSVSQFYQDDYGPYVGTRSTSEKIQSQQTLLRRSIRKLFRFNTQATPNCPPGRLLDIGCASGKYLLEMANRGWEISGIEPSPSASAYARSQGIPVHTGTPDDAPPPDTPYDLITAWMVIEHLYNPVGTLKRLHEWTKPDGWLAFSVPNISSLDFTIFKDAGYAVQDPTHIHHFDPPSIRRLLKHTGWTPVKIIHQRTLANYIGSLGIVLSAHDRTRGIGQKLLGRTDNPGIINHALYPLACIMAALGQTGRMTVWARKEVAK